MAFKEILGLIRSRTRLEWKSFFYCAISDARLWLQDNGEIALLVGVVAGAFLILFFKLVVLLVVLGGLGVYGIWCLAEPEDKQ